MPLRFHWRLIQRGGAAAGRGERVAADAALPALDEQAEFCRAAEEHGIDSVLVDINAGKPDPMVFALPLARATRKLKFLVAHRPGLMSPALFVQQVNTFSALSGGRILLNVVAGHSPAEQRAYGDWLDHDERYRRMDEYLDVCRRFWGGSPVSFQGSYYRVEEGRLNTPFVSSESPAPEIFLGGSSPQAREVAVRHATCWMRFADAPETVARDLADGLPALPPSLTVGLRLSVMVRPTAAEAVSEARRLVEEAQASRRGEGEARFVRASDSLSMRSTLALAEEEWLTPYLWAGAVPFYGATALALVGTPEDVAASLLEYGRAGVSQFILSSWSRADEMVRFGREVLPLVRRAELGSTSLAGRSPGSRSGP
ncbi:MAG TPA: LLM class flavin-dependent oxidoreductase [Thermoanaerobaculia bacterium]|jgi:alkanesulfonate monooxygenase|nr:LLM class flavin-dependent oxidoreductase [Thermoanaerobaculia bacterium]